MGISDVIAGFINDVLENENGYAELQRTELASKFKCVPSQINYVISTRFSPEHGYIVESRRGGGGYIRIRRIRWDANELVMHIVNAVGENLSWPCAVAFLSNLLDAGVIGQETARLMRAVMSEPTLKAVPTPLRGSVRASVFKQMLVQVLEQE